MLDILNFSSVSDDEIINEFLTMSKKMCQMMAMTEEEQEYFNALSDEIERREIVVEAKS